MLLLLILSMALLEFTICHDRYAPVDKTWTKESYTTDGKPCLNDCINNTCHAVWLTTNYECIPGDKPGLKYYTAQWFYKRKMCLSRCARSGFSHNFDWCYVSETEWDYCNVEREYICIDECGKHGYTYNWCHLLRDSRLWAHCSPPGVNFTVYSNMFRKCMLAQNCNTCYIHNEKRNGNTSCEDSGKCPETIEDGYVSKYGESLEHLFFTRNLLHRLTVNISIPGNPIYRHTHLRLPFSEEPTLPLVVRARITPATLRVPSSQCQYNVNVTTNLELMGMNANRPDGINDEEGYLIGYILGGPNEIYNSVPQTQRLNRGEGSVWQRTEARIRDFVRNTGGSAEMTILVIYQDPPGITRPEGFALNVALYYPNNTLHDKCEDAYYSNNPELTLEQTS